ncbi:unnamed protein product, partial [Medioppia subpectinata]
TFLTRQAFAKTFKTTPDDLDLHVIYDVSHNIAKVEQHLVDGKLKTLLVHRKGATRAFPPHHPLIPVDYQLTGQPVLIGGTMGTCSYVLTGTETGMKETFGTTCHGAGRALSRSKSRRNLDYKDVLEDLAKKGISIRVASPKLVMEEAPESYKNVTDVTTGLTGLLVSRTPHYTLTKTYNKILKNLRKMPEEYAYKRYTVQTINDRLAVVQKEKEIPVIEEKIGCGCVEELIVQAENELLLTKRLLDTKAWEPLVAKAPQNQWKWPII